MTSIPLPLVNGAFVIDNSGLELMQCCNRAHEYSALRKRILAAGKPALNFGSAIHLALEWRYKHFGADAPTIIDEDIQGQLIGRFFAENPPQEDDWRTPTHAMDLIRRYNAKYAIEAFNTLALPKAIPCGHCDGHGYIEEHRFDLVSNGEQESVLKVPCLMCNGTGLSDKMVELSFMLPLYTHVAPIGHVIPVVYSGRIDLPVKQDGIIVIYDHKTTSRLGNQFFAEQKLSGQHRGYCWAFRETFGIEPNAFGINAIRTTEVPQYVLDGKTVRGVTPEQWWEESLQRDITYLRPGELEEWKNNAIDLCEEFFWHHWRGYHPMKTKWCFGKYGECPYYAVCTLPPDQRALMLASDKYTANEWTPYKQPTQAKT
jgi:hypothetical protein